MGATEACMQCGLVTQRYGTCEVQASTVCMFNGKSDDCGWASVTWPLTLLPRDDRLQTVGYIPLYPMHMHCTLQLDPGCARKLIDCSEVFLFNLVIPLSDLVTPPVLPTLRDHRTCLIG